MKNEKDNFTLGTEDRILIDLTSDTESQENDSEPTTKPSKRKNEEREVEPEQPTIKRLKNQEDSNSIYLTFIRDQQFEIIQASQTQIKRQCAKSRVKTYDLTSSKDISLLEKRQRKYIKGYCYNRSFNKNITNIKLFIAPVYVIDDKKSHLGVFANEDLKAGDEIIAIYAGEHSRNDDDENENSKAVFQLTNKRGAITDTIDGEINGDWTACINGGLNANLFVKQEIIDGKPRICFRLGSDIAKGQQLILDYGRDYKAKLGDRFRYLHPNDDWHSPADIYFERSNNVFYAKGMYQFDLIMCKDLSINPSTKWILPKIFLYVFQDDTSNLRKLLAEDCPVDLHAYACNEVTFLDSSQQQHLTALMLAGYLARKECISILLEYGADADYCMLVNGYNPFSLLLLNSLTTNEDVEEIGLQLLRHMSFPFSSDKFNLSLLHYAMQRNSAVLVKELLKIAREDDHDFFVQMFENTKSSIQHLDVDYCIINDKFEILKLLFDDMLDKQVLVKHYNNGLVFKEQTLLKLPKDKLKKLYSLINNDVQNTGQMIYFVEAIKKYLLILLGEKPYKPEKISPSQEIDYLWKFSTQSKNLEDVHYFLKHLNPQYFFEKCLSQRHDIHLITSISPLELTIQQKPEIATQILIYMQAYLETLDKISCHDLLSQFDMYTCICLAIKANNEDIYDRLMCFYQNYDDGGELITLLLSQLIENKPLPMQSFEKIMNDVRSVYDLHINTEQRTCLLISIINFAKVNYANLNQLFMHMKMCAELIYKNFPIVSQPGFNMPLMLALENNFSTIFLYLFLNNGNINSKSYNDETLLHTAIRNVSIEQVGFLLGNGAIAYTSILEYAKQVNTPLEIIQLLQNNYNQTQAAKFPFLSHTNTEFSSVQSFSNNVDDNNDHKLY